MKLLSVEKSTRDGKKWMAIFDNDGRKKTTHFGASGYPDFTLSGDVEAKKLYMQRHKKDLDTNDPTKAGYLSYYLLWNKPTLAGSIRDYKKRFNL
jgi:hypothetical protein